MEISAENNSLIMPKKKRVWELDFLRGVAVIAMLFDHFMCDFVYLPWWFINYREIDSPFIHAMVNFANAYWDSAFRFWAHYIFVFIFLFLVGTSCAFSRDNVKRGSMLAVVAMAFTGGSMVLRVMGVLEDGIIFGILDCIALSILCAAAVDNATKRVKPLNIYAPLVIGVTILAVGISQEFWLMEYNYDSSFDASHMIGYILGTHAYGDDWFGLFPYVGAVLVGMYWGKTAYAARESLLPMLDGKWNKPFRFVGRHALIFYILHQAVLSGLVAVTCMIIGYRF